MEVWEDVFSMHTRHTIEKTLRRVCRLFNDIAVNSLPVHPYYYIPWISLSCGYVSIRSIYEKELSYKKFSALFLTRETPSYLRIGEVRLYRSKHVSAAMFQHLKSAWNQWDCSDTPADELSGLQNVVIGYTLRGCVLYYATVQKHGWETGLGSTVYGSWFLSELRKDITIGSNK